MEYYFERLNYELKKIAEFWQKYALNNNHIVPEVSNSGHPVESAPLGSIYLSRLLYGSSAASNFLQDPNFRQIADLAYRTLRNQLSNVNGGFYWAADKNGEIVHDKTNVSMAQAFAVYGLSEYYSLTGDNEIKREIFHQIDFIESKLKHYADNSYLDGFTKDWAPLKKQYRSLGTHLHLLEAYTKFIKVTDDILYKRPVEKIIELILSKFINREKGEVIHQYDINWNPVPNENWLGHNMETGWILYNSAIAIKSYDLAKECETALLTICDRALDIGFDHQYGGMFNRFINGEVITTNKEWWTQSESVIALLYAHEVSGNKKYLSYAIRLLEYIDNSFSDPEKGEWFDSITREGRPISDLPKLHMWKSMYHNVRYCIESAKHLQQLFVRV